MKKNTPDLSKFKMFWVAYILYGVSVSCQMTNENTIYCICIYTHVICTLHIICRPPGKYVPILMYWFTMAPYDSLPNLGVAIAIYFHYGVYTGITYFARTYGQIHQLECFLSRYRTISTRRIGHHGPMVS